MRKLDRTSKRQRGVTTIEYAIVVAAIIVPLSIAVERFQAESGPIIAEAGNRAGIPVEYSEGVVVP